VKQSLELKLGQRLTLTPQLRQAIRLLQLSTIELRTELREVIEGNPLLEEVEEDIAEILQTESAPEVTSDNDTDSNLDDEFDYESPDAVMEHTDPQDALNDVDINDTDGHGDSHSNDDTGIVEEAATDFDPIDYRTTVNNNHADSGLPDFTERMQSATTLHEHLIWQMNMTPFSDIDRKVAEIIIGCINEDGYLESSVEEITSMVNHEEIDVEEVTAVLHRIQTFDPIGVGARDLNECLLLQLQQKDQSTPLILHAQELVQHHLTLLAKHDFKTLKKKLRLDTEQLQMTIDLVRELNPKPGNTVETTEAEYVIPDVIVAKHNDKWQVALNPTASPGLRLNDSYQSMMGNNKDKETHSYLKNQMTEAKWIMRSLQNRHDTVLRVAQEIVKKQIDFLDNGPDAMKPLVMREIAEQLEIHESTVSRATTQKYMLTPRGVFELRYFFSSHVESDDGEAFSSTAIQSRIRKLIEDEPTSKPISDNKISDTLQEEGIKVARRTVAKYREQMNIPPSSQRKVLM